MLLAHNVDVNCTDIYGVTPLLLAGAVVHSRRPNSIVEYEDIVKMLVNHGANVNVVSEITGN